MISHFTRNADLTNQSVNHSYFPDGLKITVSWTMPDQAMKRQVISQ